MSLTQSPTRTPVTAILGACLLLIGLSAAAVAPYRAVVAIDDLGMSNGLYALIVTLSSVGTAVASLLMGHLSDRLPDRRRLVVRCAVLGGVAYGLVYLFPTRPVYIVAFCAILPFGGALFSQTFSFSRTYYDLRRPGRAEFMTSALRTVFSVAWIVVPPLAGLLAAAYLIAASSACATIPMTTMFDSRHDCYCRKARAALESFLDRIVLPTLETGEVQASS